MLLCRRAYAEHMASLVWRKFRLDLPVDVDSVAEQLKVKIHRRSIPEDPDFDGVYFKGRHHYHMMINDIHHLSRQRFTICHELGHHLLATLQVDHCAALSMCFPYNDCNEKWCDAFSAALLMPEWAIKSMSQQVRLPEAVTVQYLTHMFGVSQSAMWRRLRELDIKPNSGKQRWNQHVQASTVVADTSLVDRKMLSRCPETAW